MQCGELLLFIWAVSHRKHLLLSLSFVLIAQILQSRSFILQPCQRDKATRVGMNAIGLQVPKDKLCNLKNWLEILSGKYNTWWAGMFWICSSGLTDPCPCLSQPPPWEGLGEGCSRMVLASKCEYPESYFMLGHVQLLENEVLFLQIK